MATETEIPVWGHELKDYIRTELGAGDPIWLEVTNLLSWNFGDDENSYDPKYIDQANGKHFVLGSTTSIEYEKDMYKNNPLDEFLDSIEGKTNVPVEICRVKTWKDNEAQMARFLLTPKRLDKNSAGEPIKLKGTLSMSDDEWTDGKFIDGVFVANGSEPEGERIDDSSDEDETLG